MEITGLIGKIPQRMALAGGWIDQPFVSKLNPAPPGSMVVVSLEPQFHFMDRCGMASSTRKVARHLWPDGLPQGDPAGLVRQLYFAENQGKAEPSGSQDMVGLIYPGVSRIDYDYTYQGGYFPVRVESNNDPQVAAWLGDAIHILPVMPRPEGYNPLGVKRLEPEWISRLGQSGKDCYNAIVGRDLKALGASFNTCMVCWEAILPQVVRHPTIPLDLAGMLAYYQERYAGAMFSGSGGGYFYVAADEPVPGAFHARVRVVQDNADRNR
jgi:hypothetical protein